MSVNYIINGDTLKDIADAIREKKETSAPIDVSDFANEILTISGGSSVLISKTITENGTYNASDDHANGYSDVIVNVPSSGAQYPQATKTLIVDNTSLTNTLTFTESYTNYDFLEMVTYNSSSQKETSFLVTPSMVTASFTYSSNLMNFNEFDSDQYVCYKKTSDTVWTRNNSRNLNIKTIHGLTLSNATKTETELYSREAISGSNVALTPPAGKTFYDYDYILFMTCTGSSDETQPCNSVFMNPVKDCMFDTFVSKTININKYNTYQSSTVEADSITSYRYFYVVGLNFEYT